MCQAQGALPHPPWESRGACVPCHGAGWQRGSLCPSRGVARVGRRDWHVPAEPALPRSCPSERRDPRAGAKTRSRGHCPRVRQQQWHGLGMSPRARREPCARCAGRVGTPEPSTLAGMLWPAGSGCCSQQRGGSPYPDGCGGELGGRGQSLPGDGVRVLSPLKLCEVHGGEMSSWAPPAPRRATTRPANPASPRAPRQQHLSPGRPPAAGRRRSCSGTGRSAGAAGPTRSPGDGAGSPGRRRHRLRRASGSLGGAGRRRWREGTLRGQGSRKWGDGSLGAPGDGLGRVGGGEPRCFGDTGQSRRSHVHTRVCARTRVCLHPAMRVQPELSAAGCTPPAPAPRGGWHLARLTPWQRVPGESPLGRQPQVAGQVPQHPVDGGDLGRERRGHARAGGAGHSPPALAPGVRTPGSAQLPRNRG